MAIKEKSDTIFSPEALAKLSSPEQLDKMLPITTPINWMALAGMVVLMFSVILWSVFGAFTVKVDGMGLITDSAGVVEVSHIASGKVTEVYVHSGDTVQKKQILAKMNLPNATAETNMAQQGMGLSSSDREVREHSYQFDTKKQQEIMQEYIYSDYDGVVDNVIAEPGMLINAGSPFMTIRRTQNREDLSGVLYVPLDKAKRIKEGMTIQLVPSGADAQKTGSLLGVVRSISQYPVSVPAMKAKLGGNEQLVSSILQSANGVAMEVHFDLVKDEESSSGYLWTSVVGEQPAVSPGSFCQGSIIVAREAPISRVFYKLSQWLRSR